MEYKYINLYSSINSMLRSGTIISHLESLALVKVLSFRLMFLQGTSAGNAYSAI